MQRVKYIRFMKKKDPVIGYVEKKQPESGEVGIDILASSLCNTSELRSFKGGYKSGYGTTYPMLPGEPGHEAVGRIALLGEGVTEFRMNDLVVMTGHGGDPCHRSYVIRKEKDIALLNPDTTIPEEAAMLEMYGCAYHCAMAPGGEKFFENKKVLVIGLGAMGLCTVQILNGIKNISITAVDISDERLVIAEKSGADIAVNPDDLNKEEMFDVIIECSGSVPGQEMACRLAPSVLIFSSYNTKEIKIRQNLLFDSNTTIYNPGILTSHNFRKTVELYNAGRFTPSLLITKKINADIDEYLEAINDIKRGSVVKILMMW